MTDWEQWKLKYASSLGPREETEAQTIARSLGDDAETTMLLLAGEIRGPYYKHRSPHWPAYKSKKGDPT